MTVNDMMTPLMDKTRKLTGLTDKIGIARLTGLMDHFKLIINENLIQDAAIFGNDTRENKIYWKAEQKWNDLEVRSSEAKYYGLSPEIAVQAGETYTFSLYAKQDKENPEACIYLGNGNEDYSGMLDNTEKPIDIGTNFERYSVSFKVNKNCTIYPRVEQRVLDNQIYIAGYKLEYGDLATPLE